jgi:uncharacterized protein (DUF3820 family)
MSCGSCQVQASRVIAPGVPAAMPVQEKCPGCGQFVGTDHTCPAGMVLTFGKHNGRTLGQVMADDRGYVEWLAREAREGKVRAAASQLVRSAAPNQDALAYRLTFGKYNGRTLGDVFQEDPDYLRWLADEARSPRVRTMAQSVLDNPPGVDVARRARAVARRDGLTPEEEQYLREELEREAIRAQREKEYRDWREQRMAAIAGSLGLSADQFKGALLHYKGWQAVCDDPEVLANWPTWDHHIVWQACSKEACEAAIIGFLDEDDARGRQVDDF